MNASQQQKVANFVKSKNMVNIYSELVTKHHKRGGTAPRIMVVCENFLFVLTKAVKEKHNYPWYLLKEMKIENDTVLLLFSNDTQFKFQTQNFEKAYKTIIYHIHRILSDAEFKSINMPKLTEDLPPHSGVSLVWRLSYYLHTICRNISINDYLNIVKDIKISSKILDLSQIPQTAESFQAVFMALKLEYTFKTLIFKKVKEFDIFDIVAKYYDFQTADKLCFIGCHTGEGFKSFLQALKSAKNPRLVALSFTGIAFSNEEVDVIMHIARVKSLTSLIFDHCLNKDSFDHFQENSDLSSFRYISLENNAFFNVAYLLPHVKSLYALSLCNCGKSLGEIFDAISSADLPNLRGLNVSMNFGTQIVGKKITFPPKLSNLSADDIRWEVDDLIAFFGHVTNHASKQDLKRFVCSFSKIQIEEKDWKKFHKYIATREARNLQNFRWDENPVSPEFFDFLRKSGNIKYLSINGCIDDETYQYLVDFIKGNKVIENLLVRGSNQKKISDVLPICNALQSAPRFMFLDYCANKVEDRSLNTLLNALSKCPKLQGLAVDSTSVTSCDKYINALQPLRDLHRPISFSIPLNDIIVFQNDMNITQFRQLIHDLGCKPYPKEWPDDPVVSTYYFVPNDFFPPYLPRSAIEMINNEGNESSYSEEEESSESNKKSGLIVDEVSLPSIVVSREFSLVNEKGRGRRDRSLRTRDIPNGSLQEFPLVEEEKKYEKEKPRSTAKRQLIINKPKVSWDFPLRYVPDIDNAELLRQTDQQYSFVQIVKDLRQ